MASEQHLNSGGTWKQMSLTPLNMCVSVNYFKHIPGVYFNSDVCLHDPTSRYSSRLLTTLLSDLVQPQHRFNEVFVRLATCSCFCTILPTPKNINSHKSSTASCTISISIFSCPQERKKSKRLLCVCILLLQMALISW